MKEDAVDVMVAQTSILLGQLPSAVKHELKRDLEMVAIVNEAMGEKAKNEAEKAGKKSGGYSVTGGKKHG